MNALPESLDLSVIVGTELLQVCLGQYQIQLQFEGINVSAHIEGGGKVCLEGENQSTELFQGTWKTSRGLEQLVGLSVESWSRRDAYHFSLQFTSGMALVFETQEGPYEDFTIHIVKESNRTFLVL